MAKRMSGTRRPGAEFTPWLRPAVTVAFLSILLVLYLASDTFRGEVNRAVGVMGSGDTGALRDYILSYGAWAPVVSGALMILQALAAFVPSFLLGLANGLAFGAFWGGMLSLVSAALAASISFGIARAVGRAPVEALVGRGSLGRADRWFERYGAYAVLVARLIPVVSFDAVSYAAGLTRMGFWRFLSATTVGMAPVTFVYSYLGERAPRFAGVLLIILGVFVAAAIVAVVIRRRRRGKRV